MLHYVSIGSQQYGRIIKHIFLHILFFSYKISYNRLMDDGPLMLHDQTRQKPTDALNVQIIQITWMNTTGATPQIWKKYPDDGVLGYIIKLEHKGKTKKTHTLVQSLPLGVGTRDNKRYALI
jgi:hypothetical protein